MQAHDDQTCVTIAGDLRNLLGRLAISRQRLGSGALWSVACQPLQLRFRAITPFCFHGGQRRMTRKCANRLDNMRNEHRHGEFLADPAGDRHLVRRRRGQIDRHEHSSNRLANLIEVGRTGIGSRGDERRHRRFAEHPLGRRSEEQFSEARQSVRRHDDQAGPAFTGHAQDFRGRFAAGHLEIHLCPCPGPKRLLEEPLHLADGLFGWPDGPAASIDASSRSGSLTTSSVSRAPKCAAIALAYLRAPRELPEKSIGHKTGGIEFMIAIL